ncbi:MAG: hypothetical protein IT454_15655 [Planctomycetes bacterium]|nr:hypothetical protein [Planctomycetota bacterium]
MSWQSSAERGSLLGMRFVVWSLRTLGLWPARVVVEFIVLYYFATGRSARRASRAYLERIASFDAGRAALGGRPGAWISYRHFRTFGQMLLDRLAIWLHLDHHFVVEHTPQASAAGADAQRRGVLFLGAHFGNFDALRKLSVGHGLAISPVIFGAAPKFGAILRELDPELEARVIRLDPQDVQSVLQLKERIERGESIALLGDRAELVDQRRVTLLSFLGAPARFPQGALHVAALLQCPVYFFAGVRTGRNRYRVHAQLLVERIELARATRALELRRWTEAFAACVEENCLSAPLQWFNFYDFWASASTASEPPHADSNRIAQ